MPHDIQTDERFMLRALELARETTALTSPNPQVGCVLVREGRVVGEGAHRYAARDHAEIVALKQAGDAARGATAYVTLEPCAHHGRTGPCADALVAAGVTRVVAATQDPNPLVSAQGFSKIRAAGIEVTVGVFEQEARALNDAFAHFIQHRRPFVTLKTALSADGYLAPRTRAAREPHWLTGPEAREQVQRLRHSSDAILTGVGTVLADDPALTDRTGLPRRRPLLRVVLDTHLRSPLDSRLMDTAAGDVLLFTASSTPATKISTFRNRGVQVEVVPEDSTGLNLGEIFRNLVTREVINVLAEGGTLLNSALLRADLVDRVVLFRAPVSLGAGSVPFAGEIAPEELEQRLTHRIVTRYGTDSCTSGYLHDPWLETTLAG